MRVVGDEDDATLELVQRVSERVDGLHVEMVRGLVHEKDVRVTEADGGEHHARLLTSGELDDGGEMVMARESELSELGANLLGLVRAALGLEVGPQEVLDRVLVHGQHVDEVLGVATDAELVRAAAVALGGLEVAGEEVHQRRLARAVGADDADARAHVDAEVEVVQTETLEVGVLEVAVGEADERRRELRRGGEVELHGVVVPARRLRSLAAAVVVVVHHHPLVFLVSSALLLQLLRRRSLDVLLRRLRLTLLRRFG